MKLRQTISKKLSIVLFSAVFFLTLPLIVAAQGKIAFSSERDGNREIYLMDSNGMNQIRLTQTAALAESNPSISQNGSKIVFESLRTETTTVFGLPVTNYYRDIYIMNADGTNQTALTTSGNNFTPSFSPDGNKIVFSNGGLIYLMNADGSNKTLLNNSSDSLKPRFSLDGSKITFATFRDGNYEIYSMNSDGSNLTRLTFFSPASDLSPSFNPDGSKIVFESNRDGNNEIYLMNSDGSNQIRLTANLSFDGRPDFSPDGSKIVFQTERDSNSEIYLMNSDGSNPTRLTFTQPAFDGEPSWSSQPNGGSNNNPPTFNSVTVSSPINENDSAVLIGNIASSNAADSFVLSVNWGDNSPVQTFNYPAGTTSFAETHRYLDDNPTATASDVYQVSLTLTTSGGSDTDTTAVTVSNVAPTITNLSVNSINIIVGSIATLNGNINDVGTLDTHKITINWGDGASDTFNLAAGVASFSIPHSFNTVGNFNIGVTATDDDGGTTNANYGATTVPPTPPAAPGSLLVDYVGTSQINLRWTDNSNNESGFVIEQCRNKNCASVVQVGQVGANVTTFLDTGLLANTQYIYRVRAFNAGGDSAYSSTVTAKTLRK